MESIVALTYLKKRETRIRKWLQGGLIRIGPMSTGLSQSLPEIRNPNRRFVCFKGVTPTRSLQHSHRRNANSMGIGIFRISSDPSCTKQNPTRPSTHRNIDNTLLFYTSVVSTSVGMLTGRIGNTKFNHMLSRSKGESPFISVEQVLC